VPVAHTCNPSYLGGRNQEDHFWKPAWANSPRDPILKNPTTKNWAGRVNQGKTLSSRPRTAKKKIDLDQIKSINFHIWVPVTDFYSPNIPYPSCIRYFFFIVTTYLTKNNLRRKDLFWFMIPKDSIHASMAPCAGQERV
jgi:hypothetical protein